MQKAKYNYMKFISSIFLTALLSFSASLFLPWWIIAITAFIVALVIPLRPGFSFLAGFLALFLLWGLQAFFIDAGNHHILSEKVARLLPLGGSFAALILVSAFIGGIVAGMAALTGSLTRKITSSPSKAGYP